MASNSRDLFAQVGSYGAHADTMSPDEADNQGRLEEETDKTRRERDSGTRRFPRTHTWPARSLDPMKCLLLEISTFIIYEALPKGGDYPGRLLEYTTVSQIWQGVLLSTPSLWSELYLNDRKPDFLATVATCVHLSGKVALKVAIYGRPMYDWPGLSSILLPFHDRIVSLTVLESLTADIFRQDPSVISNTCTAVYMFLHYLGPLPQLQNLAFYDGVYLPNVSVFDKLNLPPSMRLTGELVLPMPSRSLSSATPGRFFDIEKYHPSATARVVVPPFQYCSLSLRKFERTEPTVRMKGDTLSHIKQSINYLREYFFLVASPTSYNNGSQPNSAATKLILGSSIEECGLEQFTRILGNSICYLDVTVDISQLNDLLHFLRLLMRLQTLNLTIIVSDNRFFVEIPNSNVVVYGLQELWVRLENDWEQSVITRAQGTLENLFSVLTTLYPSVTDMYLWGDTWPFSASSYLESLTELRFLYILLHDSRYDTRYNPENYSITLGTLEDLMVQGPPLLRCLHVPNLLDLRLEDLESNVDLGYVDLSSLRSLSIDLSEGGSYNLNPIDYPMLCEIGLLGYDSLSRVDILSFSRLSSIRLGTNQFTNPEGNHLCLSLLCNPEGCPSLQEIYCENSLEWDILILMLERRNFGLKGVKRIHTVTLPFVPYPIQQALDRLLVGENAERPALESISLEATREVLVDPNIPGCCRCLKNMIPGCIKSVYGYGEYKGGDVDLCQWTADELYPEYEYGLASGPSDIRDWMVCRRYLVDTWKSSYNKFRRDFLRYEMCKSDLYFGFQ